MRRGKAVGAAAVLAACSICALAGEHHVALKRFNISYAVKERLARISTVQLWVTADGGRSWKLYGVDKDKRSPVGFEAGRDGTYGFKVIAIDAAGLSDPAPTRGTRADVVIVVDTSAPKLVYTGPSGQVVGPGQEIEISYTVSDEHLGDAPISLEYSIGRGGDWSELAKNLRNTGSIKVGLPGAHGDELLIRVRATDRAGNSAAAGCGRPMIIDGKPPVVSITGPKSASGKTITVTYRAEDVGRAGVAQVSLYATSDGGRTWQLAGKDARLSGRVAFDVPRPASYGFHVVAVDRAGNASAAAGPGTAPTHTVVMDTRAPTVSLLSMAGGALAGGSRARILWKATDDNMAPSPITISCSTDGGRQWKVVARGLANTGSYLWSVPSVNSKACMVRVEAVDGFANKGSAESATAFVITTEAPSTTAFFDPKQQGVVELPAKGAPVVTDTTPERPALPDVTDVPVTPAVEKPREIPQAKLDEAARLIDSQRFADATALMTREIGLVPDSAPGLVLRARAYLGFTEPQKPRTAEAMADLKRAIAIDKNLREAWLHLGVAHFRQGKEAKKAKRLDDARTSFTQATRAYENALAAGIGEGGEGTHIEYYYCGMAYYQLYALARGVGPAGDKALRMLSVALKLGGSQKTMGGTCWYMARIYQAKGQKELAREYWKKTAGYYPPGDEFHKLAMKYYRALGGR